MNPKEEKKPVFRVIAVEEVSHETTLQVFASRVECAMNELKSDGYAVAVHWRDDGSALILGEEEKPASTPRIFSFPIPTVAPTEEEEGASPRLKKLLELLVGGAAMAELPTQAQLYQRMKENAPKVLSSLDMKSLQGFATEIDQLLHAHSVDCAIPDCRWPELLTTALNFLRSNIHLQTS